MEGNSKTQKDKNKIYGKKGDYAILGKIGEGTFSEVIKVQNEKDGSMWACKRMKQRFDKVEDIQRIREIQAIRRLRKHPNVIQLAEIIYDKGSRTLYLVCELMDMNIYELIKDRTHYLNDHKVKHYMYQLLQAIYHMHKNGIFHRDIKPENILIRGDLLKVADFGSCRSISSKQPLTEYISTRWYRAPECLLTDGYYTYKMDVWSAGCVYYEILTLRPLFPGSNELDQIAKIHDVMGTPDPGVVSKLQGKISNLDFNFPKVAGKGIVRHLSHASKDTIDLIERMCEYDPESRLTSKQALEHHHFDDYRKKLAAERRQSEADKKKTASTAASEKSAGNSPRRGGGGETSGEMAATKSGISVGGGNGGGDSVYLKRQKKKRRAPTIGALAKATSSSDSGNGVGGGGGGASSSTAAAANGGGGNQGFLILPKMMSQHSLTNDHHHQQHHKVGHNGLTVFHHSNAHKVASGSQAGGVGGGGGGGGGGGAGAGPVGGGANAASTATAKGIITLPEISRNTHYASKNALAAAAGGAGNAAETKHVDAYELPSINRQ